MAVTLNASTSTGLVQSADTSGIITLQNNGTNAVTVDNGNLQFNSGYGSVATAYGCRAWVNFNGTGTVAIRASGNVSSITDNGTADFTINLTTALTDVNYAVQVNFSANFGVAFPLGAGLFIDNATASEQAPATNSFRFATRNSLNTAFDPKYVNVAVFR